MAKETITAFRFATKGVVSALDPLLLGEQMVARMTNGRLLKQLPRTRCKFREIPLTGTDELIKEWRTLPLQGATFYNPAKGQGALTFGKDQSQIMEASGGRKFSLMVIGRGAATTARLVEKTNGIGHSPYVHLVWWCVAENYALCCDGISQLWRYDGRNPATASKGLNSVSKEDSELPNACTALVYIHYRVGATVGARRIYFGDPLHKTNLSSSANLLQATETVYWNTGQWFSPPSAMGNVMAAAPLPTRNTQHGHAECMFHCDDGVFSVQTNVSPRSAWAEQSLVKHALLKTGAAGPYAIDLVDGDQVFRSRHGIQTLRSAAAEATSLFNPFEPINGEILDMMNGDAPQQIRFTSIVNFTRGHRLYCTIYPMVDLRARWSRGFVSLNLNPTDVIPDGSRSWEGILTVPEQWGAPVQFVGGIFTGEDRLFMLCWNNALRRKTLVEVTLEEGDDELVDGGSSRISCQVWSRGIAHSDFFKLSQFVSGRLLVKDAKGEVDVGVWYRVNGHGEWRYWRMEKYHVQPTDCRTLQGYGGRDITFNLGEFPANNETFRYVQFMVRWRGLATIEALEISVGNPREPDNMEVPQDGATDLGKGTLAFCGYDDFEYSGAERWEEQDYAGNNSGHC